MSEKPQETEAEQRTLVMRVLGEGITSTADDWVRLIHQIADTLSVPEGVVFDVTIKGLIDAISEKLEE